MGTCTHTEEGARDIPTINKCRATPLNECSKNKLCFENKLPEPSTDPSVCTHTEDSAQYADVVEKCPKVMDLDLCRAASGCNWNFYQTPTNDRGQCTHKNLVKNTDETKVT